MPIGGHPKRIDPTLVKAAAYMLLIALASLTYGSALAHVQGESI
jgi:hypothetical protein